MSSFSLHRRFVRDLLSLHVDGTGQRAALVALVALTAARWIVAARQARTIDMPGGIALRGGSSVNGAGPATVEVQNRTERTASGAIGPDRLTNGSSQDRAVKQAERDRANWEDSRRS